MKRGLVRADGTYKKRLKRLMARSSLPDIGGTGGRQALALNRLKNHVDVGNTDNASLARWPSDRNSSRVSYLPQQPWWFRGSRALLQRILNLFGPRRILAAALAHLADQPEIARRSLQLPGG